jgi:YggT family protein
MQALYFLLKTVTDFFCVLLILRLMLQWRRVSFASPFGGFVLKLTNWAVLPLRRLIPGVGGIDWASLVVAFAAQFAFVLLVFALIGAPTTMYFNPAAGMGVMGGIWLTLLALAAKNLVYLVVWLLIVILIAQAVLSWISPWSPLAPVLRQLTHPLLAPVQRLIPPISGIDLSPLVVILVLQALLLLLQ